MTIKNSIVSPLELSANIESPPQLFHPGLKDLLKLEDYLDCKIGFLSIEIPLPSLFKKFTQALPNYAFGLHLRREYRHLGMGIKALKYKDRELLFVFEAYNQHLLLLLPLLLLTGKKVLIMLHGNQQFAIHSKIKYWGLLYLKLFLFLSKKIKVILLEIDDRLLPEKVRLPKDSKIIIPHPIVEQLTPRLPIAARLTASEKIKIGIVGTIRADKPVAKLIKIIQTYLQTNSQAELIIGTPSAQKPQDLKQLDLKIYDTTKEQDYFKVLQEIDILVTHYDRDRYYYRTSGVISDAAAAGCYIIASDYPVIKHQITYPVTIGETFSNFDEIPAKIDRAIAFIKDNGQDNHWRWREKRTAKSIAEIISC